MPSQFDQTTERKSDEYGDLVSIMEPPGRQKQVVKKLGKKDFTSGRNSTKASMEILARAVQGAVEAMRPVLRGDPFAKLTYGDLEVLLDDIAAVRERGDWPLGV